MVARNWFVLSVGLALGLSFLFGGLASGHDGDGGLTIGNSAPANNFGFNPPPLFNQEFDSKNVRLHSHLWLDEIGNLGASNVIGNDIWGWTDEASGREFAAFGLTNATSFIEVTNPSAPRYLGSLQTVTGNRTWRDVKVYNQQAYIVSDSNGAHGMQVFDMTQLLTADVADPMNPTYFDSVGVYTGVTNAHNVVINEDSGYAYIVGSNRAAGGMHVLDLNGGSAGTMPTFVGDFSADGYTHDAQVVNYAGPDSDYAGREIAFNSNEDTLTIVDVTNKANMTQIAGVEYADSEYAHQGWLSEDQRFFYMNDELDELRRFNAGQPIQTSTRVWDVSDLDNPFLVGVYEGTEGTIDHNLYVKGDLMFQANYESGLRILRVNDAATMDIEEFGYFDTYFDGNEVTFNGAWSVFPFFDSGTVIVSDRQNGLFILSAVPEPSSLTILGLMGMVISMRRRR